MDGLPHLSARPAHTLRAAGRSRWATLVLVVALSLLGGALSPAPASARQIGPPAIPVTSSPSTPSPPTQGTTSAATNPGTTGSGTSCSPQVGLSLQPFCDAVGWLFGGVANATSGVAKYLGTIPDFASNGKILQLEDTSVTVALALLALVLTVSVIQLAVLGMSVSGGGGIEAVDAVTGTVAAVGAILLWRGAVGGNALAIPQLTIGLTNTITRTIIDSGAVQSGLGQLALTVGAVAGTIIIGALVLENVLVAILGALALIEVLVFKIALTATVAVLVVGMPIAIVIAQVQGFDWIRRAATRTYAACLVVPILWAVMIGVVAVLGSEVIQVTRAAGSVASVVTGSSGPAPTNNLTTNLGPPSGAVSGVDALLRPIVMLALLMALRSVPRDMLRHATGFGGGRGVLGYAAAYVLFRSGLGGNRGGAERERSQQTGPAAPPQQMWLPGFDPERRNPAEDRSTPQQVEGLPLFGGPLETDATPSPPTTVPSTGGPGGGPPGPAAGAAGRPQRPTPRPPGYEERYDQYMAEFASRTNEPDRYALRNAWRGLPPDLQTSVRDWMNETDGRPRSRIAEHLAMNPGQVSDQDAERLRVLGRGGEGARNRALAIPEVLGTSDPPAWATRALGTNPPQP